MRMFFFGALLFVSLPSFLLAETVIENSGFVPGNLWFSKEPTTVGETIQIYTIVWNASKNDVSGSVSFFDNDKKIDSVNFILSGEGSTKILSVPWKVSDGYHKIYARITESLGGPRGVKASSVTLEYGKTNESEQFIAPPRSAEASATTTAKNYISDSVEYAKGYAKENLPDPVVETASGISKITNGAREKIAEWSVEKKEALKKSINESKTSSNKSSSGGIMENIKSPLAEVGVFFFSLLGFLTGNKYVFYGLILVTAFFFIRFLKRTFF